MSGEGAFFTGLTKGNGNFEGAVFESNNKKILMEDFQVAPSMSAVIGSAATATSASIMSTGKNCFLTTPIVGQTLIAPVIAATGLNVAGDQTANDGREIDFSCCGAIVNPLKSYKVGGGAFYGKLQFSIDDVSGTDVCLFGFRKAAAHAADYNAYTDMAALNVVSGDIKIATIVNDATTVTTDTTDNWADAAVHTLEIYVDNDGAVTYKIDGDAPTVTAAVTLDTDDSFIPFFQFLQDTDLAASIILQKLEVGLQ